MITLYWDFFGPVAVQLAAHQLEHLGDFLRREGLVAAASGTEQRRPLHAAAWLDLAEADAERVAQALRPRRREPGPRPAGAADT